MLQKADILKLRPGEENVNATRMLRLNNLDEMFASSQGARIINDETLVGKNLAKDFTDAIYSIVYIMDRYTRTHATSTTPNVVLDIAFLDYYNQGC